MPKGWPRDPLLRAGALLQHDDDRACFLAACKNRGDIQGSHIALRLKRTIASVQRRAADVRARSAFRDSKLER
jgi:hypothetical protein